MVISDKQHTLLVEKYRPTKLEDYVGNENIKATISKYLSQNDIQNLIFYGPPGTGKTTLAKLIVNNLNCDHLYINASDERGIETIRDKVSGFASSASFKPLKVIILDEADFLTIQAQASLRNVIETFSRSTRFILTCNYIERIIDPLQSRCQVLKIVPPSMREVASHIAGILDNENIEWAKETLGPIVKQYYPDIRKILGTAQLSTIDNKLVLDKSILVSNNYIEQVINELKTGKNWKTIRQIIADSNINDYDELFKALYDNVSTYAPQSEGLVTIYINEHSYQANFRIDKEINMMACIAQIIQVEKKELYIL
jgi:replication factor C small subunit